MKTILASLLLIPAVAFGQNGMDDLIRSIQKQAQIAQAKMQAQTQANIQALTQDPGDPAFIMPNMPQPKAQSATDLALGAYLRQQTTASQVYMFSPPDINIQASDSFADIQHAQHLNQQNAQARAAGAALARGLDLDGSQAAARSANQANQMRNIFGN